MGEVFQFGEFRLDPSRYALERRGRAVRLENRPMELLTLLVERHGELVSRDEVAQRLWGAEVFVDVDQGINTAIRKVRMALQDDPDKPRFVETVIGKGYRFSAVVTSSREIAEAAGSGEVKDAASSSAGSSQSATAASLATFNSPASSQARTEWSGDTKKFSTGPKLLVAGLCALIIVSSGWMVSRRYRSNGAARGAVRSLAVLPLKNLSGDPAQEYLADGMTEELIGRLAGIRDLRVISRTSTMRFKSTQLTAPEISKMLSADALVEGSVIREGNHIRVHAQLIRGATDEHFWSETYDRELADVLSLQSEVAQAIAEKVKATITGSEQERLAAAHTVVPEAYELYLKGRFALNSSNSNAQVDESVRYFENAIQKDPEFAPAYVALAEAHLERGTVMMGGRADTERPQVKAMIVKALQLDPNLPEAHLLLAKTVQTEWRWAQAQSEYQRALELSPNEASVHDGIAYWMVCQGRFDEALRSAERARELDRSGDPTSEMAWILFHARRYDEAIRELRSILAVRGDDARALWLLGFTLTMKGQAKDAIPVLEKAAALAEHSSGYMDVLALAYARAGRRSDALRLLAELRRRRKETGYVPAASFVIVYLGLDDKEQAFAWLDQAYKERSNLLQLVKVHPLFDSLRDDRRFDDLVHRVGLQ